jgi:hypothetical protein
LVSENPQTVETSMVSQWKGTIRPHIQLTLLWAFTLIVLAAVSGLGRLANIQPSLEANTARDGKIRLSPEAILVNVE